MKRRIIGQVSGQPRRDRPAAEEGAARGKRDRAHGPVVDLKRLRYFRRVPLQQGLQLHGRLEGRQVLGTLRAPMLKRGEVLGRSVRHGDTIGPGQSFALEAGELCPFVNHRYVLSSGLGEGFISKTFARWFSRTSFSGLFLIFRLWAQCSRALAISI